MDSHTRQKLVHQIMAGQQIITIGKRKYLVKAPSGFLQYQSLLKREEVLHDERFSTMLTAEKAYEMIGWGPQAEQRVEKFYDVLENLKVDLYQAALKADTLIADLRKKLTRTRASISSLLSQKHQFDEMTLEGYADLVRAQYIAANTVYTLEGHKLWDEDNAPMTLLNRIIEEINAKALSDTQIRELARTEPWGIYWRCGEQPFDVPVKDLSRDQQLLIVYSKMYDNAYESLECPPDHIIEDDDMFDGWKITQRRKHEKNKMQKHADESVGDKHRGAGELFIPAKDAEHARKINQLNDQTAAEIKKQREQVIKKKGKVKESQLPDVQRDLQMQANQQYMDTVKGNK